MQIANIPSLDQDSDIWRTQIASLPITFLTHQITCCHSHLPWLQQRIHAVPPGAGRSTSSEIRHRPQGLTTAETDRLDQGLPATVQGSGKDRSNVH